MTIILGALLGVSVIVLIVIAVLVKLLLAFRDSLGETHCAIVVILFDRRLHLFYKVIQNKVHLFYFFSQLLN